MGTAELAPGRLILSLDTDNPEQFSKEMKDSLAAAILGLTEPGTDPVTPARSEAIDTLLRLLLCLSEIRV